MCIHNAAILSFTDNCCHYIVSCRNTCASKMSNFLNMMPRGLVYICQFFGAACCPHSQHGTVTDWTAVSTNTAVITSESTRLLFDDLLKRVFTSKVLSVRVTNVKFWQGLLLVWNLTLRSTTCTDRSLPWKLGVHSLICDKEIYKKGCFPDLNIHIGKRKAAQRQKFFQLYRPWK